MKSYWCGDNHDKTKWSRILAHREKSQKGANSIHPLIYVPFWNDAEKDGWRGDVLDAFDYLKNPAILSKFAKVNLFTVKYENTTQYFNAYEEFIQSFKKPYDVFLDPDTGIKERKDKNMKHVFKSDISFFWKKMSPGSFLYVYQHSQRRAGWREAVRDQLQDWLGAKVDFVSAEEDNARGSQILWAQKS